MINLNKIRGLRAEKGMTQDDVSRLLGISRTTYQIKESGKTEFTLNEMSKLADAFGTSIDDLIKKAN